jgi:hypothetical protein
MAVKLYCEEVPQEGHRSFAKFHELMEKEMEYVRKEHYSAFYKHFHICDHTLGPEFLQKIQAHYDNNLMLKMLIEKLQILIYFFVNKE